MTSGHSVEFAGSGMFRLQFGCSGGTSPLGVDGGAPRAAQTTLFAIILKVGALRVVSALVLRRFTVMETSVFVAGAGVGASRGVPAFKRT